MADFKENVENLNVRQIVMSSVMTAFGLVVALVWKDTIVATVDTCCQIRMMAHYKECISVQSQLQF